jgi:flagellar basal body-associated protein FliL
VKSKLKFIIPLVLVLVGGVYKFVLAKPAPTAEPKVAGEVYVLPKEFLVNLSDGRFAKVQVGLVLEAGEAAAHSGGAAPAAPPEGFGTNPQEALVRDIVTDTLTDGEANSLISRHGREELKKKLARRIVERTDVHVEEVLFTDVTVQ